MNRLFACRAFLLGAWLTAACSGDVNDPPGALQAGTGSGGSAESTTGTGTGTGTGGSSVSDPTGDPTPDSSSSPVSVDASSAGEAAVAPSDAGGIISYDSSAMDPGTEGDGVRELASIPQRAPELSVPAGAPRGKTIRFTFKAGESKIFPKAPSRLVEIYVPAQYVAGTPAPLMVVQDAENFYGFPQYFSATVDTLVFQKKLPPIIGVFANNGGGDAQGSERGLEYDTLSGTYAEWVDQEVLPRAELETKTQLPNQAVTFTHDPEGRGSIGGSSGGIAAFTMLWYHPDLFRRTITYSGTYVAQESPKNPLHPEGGWNYHEDKDLDDGGLIAHEPSVKPIRAWLECGTRDNGSGSSASGHYNFELASQRMELKLAAKGYHIHLDHIAGAGHVDQGAISGTFPAAMEWVWRGYVPGGR